MFLRKLEKLNNFLIDSLHFLFGGVIGGIIPKLYISDERFIYVLDRLLAADLILLLVCTVLAFIFTTILLVEWLHKQVEIFIEIYEREQLKLF